MKLKIALVALTLIASPALAQQPPNPAFLQRALTAMQSQRNRALDSEAISAAQVATLTDDLAKANARIKELEKKPSEPSEGAKGAPPQE